MNNILHLITNNKKLVNVASTSQEIVRKSIYKITYFVSRVKLNHNQSIRLVNNNKVCSFVKYTTITKHLIC